MKHLVVCKQCSKEYFVFNTRLKKTKFCSQSCRSIYTGFLKRQKAKPRISTQGYYFICKPHYHRANKQGYAKLADIIMEKKIQRTLNKNEVVHHIDRNKLNDSPKNLIALTKIEHSRLHAKLNWENKKFPVVEKKYNWANFPKREAIKLFLSGFSLRAIGRKYGVKHNTVKTHLIYWGAYANN